MEWIIDSSNTKVEFALKHFWGLATVKGQFKRLQGSLNFDPANPVGWSARVELEASSLYTSQARRDKHLRSADFFDVEKYPLITFRSRQVEQLDSGNFRLTGDLTIRNVTRPVTLEVSSLAQPDGERVIFQASTSFSRYDMGITFNKLPIGSEVRLNIELAAVGAVIARS